MQGRILRLEQRNLLQFARVPTKLSGGFPAAFFFLAPFIIFQPLQWLNWHPHMGISDGVCVSVYIPLRLKVVDEQVFLCIIYTKG